MVIRVARVRDGSGGIKRITEVVGAEGDVIIARDRFVYDMEGEEEAGKIVGKHKSTGMARPSFWDRARYYNQHHALAAALDRAQG